jgi:hypothetical protein
LDEHFDLKFEHGISMLRKANGDQAWQVLSTSYGPTKALVSSLNEVRRAELRRDLVAFYAGFQNELGIAMPRDYLLTYGLRR